MPGRSGPGSSMPGWMGADLEVPAASSGWGPPQREAACVRGNPLGRAGACRASEGRTIPCNSLDGPPVGPPGLQGSGSFPQQLSLHPEHGSRRTESPPPPGPQVAAGLGPAGGVTPMSSFLTPTGLPSSTSCSTPWRRATTPAAQTRCGRRSPRARGGRVAAQCPAPTEAPRGWGAVG